MNSQIQIRFIQGTAWDSRAIEFQTRAWCSHVEAIIPALCPLTMGALVKGGVRMRRVNDECYQGVARWEIWHIPCEPYQSNNFWEFLDDQFGKPYDWRAIASFAFGQRNWLSHDAWFCSELQFAAMREAGLYTPPAQLPCDRLTPRDAYLIFTGLPGAWK